MVSQFQTGIDPHLKQGSASFLLAGEMQFSFVYKTNGWNLVRGYGFQKPLSDTSHLGEWAESREVIECDCNLSLWPLSG
jgi:hypothetical protein